MNAVLMMAIVGLGIVVIWWLCHVTSLVGGSTDPVNLYAETGTMGTILLLFVYVLTAFSLPVFIWRRHRASFSILRHVLAPALGVLVLVIPFAESFQPGQPAPYNVFPYLAVAILVASALIAWLVMRRDPSPTEGGP